MWDGVFSKEQAGRGQTAYRSLCARCHGDTLLGGESAPRLAGEDFLEKWRGKTVGAMVELTRKSMPTDGLGKLTWRHCTDMIAYLLAENGFPAGDAELATELAALDTITIQPKH